MFNMKKQLLLLLLLLLLFAISCGEQKDETTLLRIEKVKYGVEDFESYMSATRVGESFPMDIDLIDEYLNEYLEFKLLHAAAVRDGYEIETSGNEFDIANETVWKFLQDEAFAQMNITEQELYDIYEEQYQSTRVRISSIYIEDQNTARQVKRDLNGTPDLFDSMMERHNPEIMKEEGVGVGVFTQQQIPEDISDALYELEEPGIIGPILFGEGYMIVRLEENMDRTPFEEVRSLIVTNIQTRKRFALRKQMIEKLRQEIDHEFNPELAAGSSLFSKNTKMIEEIK